jgi:hypothetical protein
VETGSVVRSASHRWERRVKGHWKTIAVVAAVAVIALSVVAVAYGATRTSSPGPAAGSGACGALMRDAKGLEAMQALSTEHRAEMQAWYDQYGPDSSSAEAKAALRQLREEHWNDMQDLFKKLGIEAPAGQGPGGGMMRGGGCGGAGVGQGGGCGGAGVGQGAGCGGGMMGSGGMMGGWN